MINEFYKENRLMEGTLKIRGEPVLLSNLKANLMNVIAEADHITPPCQSERVMDFVGSSDKDLFASMAAISGSWRDEAQRRRPGRISTSGWLRGPIESAEVVGLRYALPRARPRFVG